MKKLFLLALAVIGLSFTAESQTLLKDGTGFMLSSPTHANTDTITNAGGKTLKLEIPSWREFITVQPVFTKISGTVAGTAQLQGSLDNTNFVNVGSAYTITDVASQTTSIIVTPSNYRYYRLLITSSGTQSTKVIVPVLTRVKP